MALSIDNPTEIVRLLTLRTERAANAAGHAIVGFLRQDAGPTILDRARRKAPKLWRKLYESGVEYDIDNGTRIAFGYEAADYAARQHEDDSISHTGARAYKWVYRGAGVTATSRGGGVSNPGEWNVPTGAVKRGYRGRITAWANMVTRKRPFYGGATGEELIEWAGNNWRFRKVGYAVRRSSAMYPKTGQAHFLFGAPNSALEELRPWLLNEAAIVGLTAAREAL